MKKSKQTCTVCLSGFEIGRTNDMQIRSSKCFPASTSCTTSVLSSCFHRVKSALCAGWTLKNTTATSAGLPKKQARLNAFRQRLNDVQYNVKRFEWISGKIESIYEFKHKNFRMGQSCDLAQPILGKYALLWRYDLLGGLYLEFSRLYPNQYSFI